MIIDKDHNTTINYDLMCNLHYCIHDLSILHVLASMPNLGYALPSSSFVLIIYVLLDTYFVVLNIRVCVIEREMHPYMSTVCS